MKDFLSKEHYCHKIQTQRKALLTPSLYRQSPLWVTPPALSAPDFHKEFLILLWFSKISTCYKFPGGGEGGACYVYSAVFSRVKLILDHVRWQLLSLFSSWRRVHHQLEQWTDQSIRKSNLSFVESCCWGLFVR